MTSKSDPRGHLTLDPKGVEPVVGGGGGGKKKNPVFVFSESIKTHFKIYSFFSRKNASKTYIVFFSVNRYLGEKR